MLPMNCRITPRPPLRLIEPRVGGRSPAMIFSSVVLPEPLGPTSATTAPSPTRNETSSSRTRPSGRSKLTPERSMWPMGHHRRNSAGDGTPIVGIHPSQPGIEDGPTTWRDECVRTARLEIRPAGFVSRRLAGTRPVDRPGVGRPRPPPRDLRPGGDAARPRRRRIAWARAPVRADVCDVSDAEQVDDLAAGSSGRTARSRCCMRRRSDSGRTAASARAAALHRPVDMMLWDR